MKLTKLFIPIILITLGLCVFITGLIFLDPDFGWHLRAGQVIVQSGIQVTDPFSYTMPSYHFIDHEWLTNVLMFLIYKNLGIYFLSAIFAFIFVSALYLTISSKLRNYAPLPLLLAGLIMIGFSGVRTQEITWLFLALLLKVIFDESLWKKWKFFVPLIFLPWVNLHGGFAVGIAVLAVVFVLETVKNRKIAFDNLKIFILSLLVTFINPYGPRIWYEIWMQVSDSSLRWHIAEWLPGVFYFDIALCVLFALSFFLILIYRKKLNFTKIGIYIFLLLMAVSSLRHIPLWAICAVFLTCEVFVLFWDQIKKNKENVKRLEKIKNLLIIVFLALFLYKTGSILLNGYNLNFYPQKAVSFLQKQNIKGNIFATYDVGGYLIWKLPGHKVFIDGRMPSWRRTGFYPNESNYAFKDYSKMLSDDNFFAQEIRKYNITYVLFPKPAKKGKPSMLQNAEDFLQKILFKFKNTDSHVLSEDLTKIGLRRVYDDGRYVIYER
jgi:hypothetical protein